MSVGVCQNEIFLEACLSPKSNESVTSLPHFLSKVTEKPTTLRVLLHWDEKTHHFWEVYTLGEEFHLGTLNICSVLVPSWNTKTLFSTDSILEH